jgi:hypothetical protein
MLQDGRPVGRDGLALPVGEPFGEGLVPDGQVGDPLVDLPWLSPG